MKRYKPTTPSRRSMTTVTYKGVLTESKPAKSLTFGRKSDKGRNAFGRITSYHRGGGHKKRFRDIDFLYEKHDIPYTVKTVEYDPNRTAFIARVAYRDGEQRYIVVPQKVSVGDALITSEKAPLQPGNRTTLKNIPVGTFVYNVEVQPRGGAKMIRSAGTYAEVIAQEGKYVDLKMPSSEVRKIHKDSWATVGEVSNDEHEREVGGKAGRSRWKGRRPKVRGSAMNPVDHPNGGGEGRGGRGTRRQKTRHGRPTGKGQRTRTPKKYSNTAIVKRRKVGKRR